MDTEALKAFINVAELGSFSQAAERLYLTQPAISKRIKNLEELLDTQLFDRIGRHITLTESGQVLLPRARRILQEITDSHHEIHALSGAISGTLKLGISHHIGLYRLPKVLSHFKNKYPAVSYEIEFYESEIAYEEISHGELDLALVTLNDDESHYPKIFSQSIWTDQLYFCANAQHPLSQSKEVSLKQLSSHAAVLPQQQTQTGRLVAELFIQRELPLSIATQTNYLESIKMLCRIGLGWSVLPQTMLDDELLALPVPFIQLKRQLGYIHHKERSLSNASRAFIKLLKQHQR